MSEDTVDPVLMARSAVEHYLFGPADASSGATARTAISAIPPTIKPGTNTSFASLTQINVGVLNVGYAESGAANGPAVLLLHGWPCDIHSYVDVAPALGAAVYRVIVQYLRGNGTTRFLSNDTACNPPRPVIAVDIVALMDAVQIERASRSTTRWNSDWNSDWNGGWPKLRSSPCPPSPSKGMPMVHPTRRAVLTSGSSQASMCTAPSLAASGTICRGKPRRPLAKRSSMSTIFDPRRFA
jgi:hypothetical protein